MCVVALLGGERFVSGGWAKTGADKAIFESENGGAREKGQKQTNKDTCILLECCWNVTGHLRYI